MIQTRVLLVFLLPLILMGCKSSAERQQARTPKDKGAAKSVVKLSGQGKLLTKADESAARQLSGWAEKMSLRIQQGHIFDAAELIRQSPESALRWLWLKTSQVTESTRRQDQLTLEVVAQLYDKHMLQLAPHQKVGWTDVLAWIRVNPETYADYLQYKRQFQMALENKSKSARQQFATLQSWRKSHQLPLQLAMAIRAGWLLPIQLDQQSAYWQAASDEIGTDPLLAMQVLLQMGQQQPLQHAYMLSALNMGDRLMQQGIFPERQWLIWLEQRQKLSEGHGHISLSEYARIDQLVLKSLSGRLGPDVQLTWQTDLRPWLLLHETKAKTGAGLPAVKCLVLAHVGLKQLKSGQSQAALFTFKKAEYAAGDLQIENELRLHQARALAGMNQTGGSNGLLISLVSLKSPVGRSAMSSLAVLKMKQDQPYQAIQLWEKALASESLEVWPGRAQAQADLALAYLMQGKEEKGLDLLHRAQKVMKQTHKPSWLHAMDNERHYYEQTQQPRKATDLMQKIALLQAGH